MQTKPGKTNIMKSSPAAHHPLESAAKSNEDGYHTLTFPKHPGVTYLGQSAAISDATAFSAATTTVMLDDASTLKFRDNFSTSGTGQRFMRVRVTAAP